jgi:hypothetical protein
MIRFPLSDFAPAGSSRLIAPATFPGFQVGNAERKRSSGGVGRQNVKLKSAQSSRLQRVRFRTEKK